jgi:hypothetical protein
MSAARQEQMVLASSGTVLATSTGLLLLVAAPREVVFAITVRSHETTPSCAHSEIVRTSCATASGACVNGNTRWLCACALALKMCAPDIFTLYIRYTAHRALTSRHAFQAQSACHLAAQAAACSSANNSPGRCITAPFRMWRCRGATSWTHNEVFAACRRSAAQAALA